MTGSQRKSFRTPDESEVYPIAVHVAARILGLARPGEVLVSGTTRDLIASRELAFVDRGLHELKGVSRPRAVFALGAGAP